MTVNIMKSDPGLLRQGLSRRKLIKDLAFYGGGLAAAGLLPSYTATAADAVVTGYGVTTASPTDWNWLKADTGIEMRFTGSNNDVGEYLHSVIDGEIGRKADILIFEAGTQNLLAERGFYAEIDVQNPLLTNWETVTNFWRSSPGTQNNSGVQYGIPLIVNADSFGYFPELLGVTSSPSAPISWSLLFEAPETRGKVGIQRAWNYSMPSVANYLKVTGKVPIEDPANPTGGECKRIADYMIERKRAGQFRTFYSSFEEQVQLLVNKEVVVLNCWEPAVKEANKKLGAGVVQYAFAKEGYYKWEHAAYVSKFAVDNKEKMENIYKVLNWLLGGHYHAQQAIDRGYGGPNMGLALQYAKDNQWLSDQIEDLTTVRDNVDIKFKSPFESTTMPSNGDSMQTEWERFLNA